MKEYCLTIGISGLVMLDYKVCMLHVPLLNKAQKSVYFVVFTQVIKS